MTTPLTIDEAETKPIYHKTNLSSSVTLPCLFASRKRPTMAVHKAWANVTPLRVITRVLATAHDDHLPAIAHKYARLVQGIGPVWTLTASDSRDADQAETAVLVYQFKKQLSNLVHDKSATRNFTAILFIKAVVEAAGLKSIQTELNLWVKGLLNILRVSLNDPYQSNLVSQGLNLYQKSKCESHRNLCVLTLTRIFLLTHESSELIREITTPNLPAFVASCVNLVRAQYPLGVSHDNHDVALFHTVIRSLSELLPSHPTQFRPFTSQLQTLIVEWLAPGGPDARIENSIWPQQVASCARELLVLLPQCAPKNVANGGWSSAVIDVVRSIHLTANQVFRAFEEDWLPSSSLARSLVSATPLLKDDVEDSSQGPFGLQSWSGIDAGLHRLSELLGLLDAFTRIESMHAIVFPINDVLDAVERIMYLTPPPNWKKGRVRTEVDTLETTSLVTYLPVLHIAAINLLSSLMTRFESSVPIVLDNLTAVFQNGNLNQSLRNSCYQIALSLVENVGSALSREDVQALEPIFGACVSDMLSIYKSDDILHGQRTSTFCERLPEILTASILRNIPANNLNNATRNQLEAAAVLTRLDDALLSSALNVPTLVPSSRTSPSVLPFLARLTPTSAHTEALTRPQMPVTNTVDSTGGLLAVDAGYDTLLQNGSHEGADHEIANVEQSAASIREEFEKSFGIVRDSPQKGADTETHVPDVLPATFLRTETSGTSAANHETEPAEAFNPEPTLKDNNGLEWPADPAPAPSHEELSIPGQGILAGDSDESDFEMPTLEVQSDIGMITDEEAETSNVVE